MNSSSENSSQGRSQDFSKGGHTVPNIIVMAFSPRNIVGCLLKKGLQRGVTGTPGPPSLRPWLYCYIWRRKLSCLKRRISPRELHLYTNSSNHLKHSGLSSDRFHKRTGDSGRESRAKTSDHVQHTVGLFGDNRSGGRNCGAARFYLWKGDTY